MAPTVLTYKTDADVVKTEGPHRYSRDEAILAANAAKLNPGAVLGQVTATKKLVPLAPAASDGSQTAHSLLLETVPVRTADSRVVILARHAEVVLQALEWPAGINDNQKTAALNALLAKGIVARNGV